MSKKNKDQIRQRSRFWGGFIVVLFGASVLLMAAAANGPDFVLHFEREIPSTLSPERLQYNIASTTRWPQWFYSLAKVRVLESALEDPAMIREGARLSLLMDPGKAMSKRFEIIARVKKYVPGKLVTLEIENDSTSRLSRIFKNLEWTIEFTPKDSGTLIRGTASATTCHWRSRLFGRIAERVVMNQIYYPNLIKLAELRQPFSADSPLEADQSTLWK